MIISIKFNENLTYAAKELTLLLTTYANEELWKMHA